MTTVFVAGSRAISKLNDQIRERLDNIMREQLSVLVGDANGADKVWAGVLSTKLQMTATNCSLFIRVPFLGPPFKA
jgi:hypothetical protein